METTEQSAYKALVENLRSRIESGQIAIGATLPSTASLTREFNVSTTVVKNAVRELKVIGYAHGQQGKAVYARLPDPPEWLGPLLIAGFQLAAAVDPRASAESQEASLEQWKTAVAGVPERFQQAVDQQL
jgi:DNA-binding FadR family transcriptional regulator